MCVLDDDGILEGACEGESEGAFAISSLADLAGVDEYFSRQGNRTVNHCK